MIKKLLKKLQLRFNLVKPQKMIDAMFKGYVVLIIVPVFIFGCVFSSMYSNKILEYSKNKSVLLMNSAIDILNEKIDFMNNVTYNLATDKDFLSFNKYDIMSAERSIALFNMRTTLEFFLEQSDIIDDIFIYYKEGTVVLGRESDYKITEKINLIFGMDKDGFESFLDAQNRNFVKMLGRDAAGNEKAYLVYTKSLDNWLRPGNIYAVYLLDEGSMMNILNMVNEEQSGNVFLLHNRTECLLSGDNTKIDSRLIDHVDMESEPDDYGFRTVKYNGQKYLVLTGDIGTSGLQPYYAVEQNFYLKQIRYIWLAILLVCIFIIAIGMGVAKIYAMRIYRPIMNISQLFKPDKYRENPGQRFIDSKFVEIQQIQEQLTSYNQEHQLFIRERQLSYFLKKYITDSADLRQQLGGLGVCTDSAYYAIVLIKIDKLKDISENIDAQYYREFVKKSFMTEAEAYFQGSYSDMPGFYDEEYIGILICYDRYQSFGEGFGFVQQRVQQQLDTALSLYYKEGLEEWSTLPDAYEALRSMVKQLKLGRPGMLLCWDNWDNTKKYMDFGVYSSKIVTLLKGKRYDELDTMIDSLFAEGSLLFDQTVYLFSSFLIVFNSVMDHSSMGEEFFVTNPYRSIDDFSSMGEITAYLKSLCRRVGENMMDGVSGTDVMYDKMIGYIHDNYKKQITQREAAETFGFSVGYFSRYFKSVVGKSFIETLNCYRIERAKQLIEKDRTVKIIKISEEVGFVSYKTFSDAFKRYEGISPEKYKRSLL